MGFILPGCNADSCSCLQVRSLRLFCCKVLQSKRCQESLQSCTHCWAPSSALGHSGWHGLKADPEVSAEQTEQMGKRCFSHPRSEEKQCQINGQKEPETKQQGVCVCTLNLFPSPVYASAATLRLTQKPMCHLLHTAPGISVEPFMLG